jgi:hypothetical protein
MTINWRTTVRENWYYSAEGRVLEHQYELEYPPASSLRLHETPAPRRVARIATAMRAGTPIPMPSVGDDGMMLDGHHRAAAAQRVAGLDALIPTEVHEIADVTSQAEFLRGVDANLSQACERIEAGFYFEEGGCFGMALALHATFTQSGIKASLAVDKSFIHAYVLAHGHLYDHQGRGRMERPASLVTLEPNAFLEFAYANGHGDDRLQADQGYALNAIDVAIALAEHDEPTPEVRPSHAVGPSL